MKKVLALGASNSSKSINKELASHIAKQLSNVEIQVLNWEEIELPLYSSDIEEESGIPKNAHKFLQLIAESDAIVLSLAEHNGLPTAAFKNLWDWTSRIEKNFWANKPMLLAATSPGGRGGIGVLTTISNMISRFGGNVITEFTLPSFYDNFKDNQIIDDEITKELNQKIETFQASI